MKRGTTPHEEGDPDSKILFLGEAPARTEVRLGRPLVGPSGDVFNDCLHQAGLVRAQCYILNVWPNMVYKDKQDNIFDAEGDPLYDKTGFTEKGWRLAQPTLEKIAASSANVICPMGKQAIHLALGDKRAVTKWRGSVILGSENVQGRKVIPTIHPAATLHGTYLWRYLLINDYGRALEECESRELVPPQYSIEILKHAKDAIGFLEECHRHERICTDLEVINHQTSCFSAAHDPSFAAVIPLHHFGDEPYWTVDEEVAIWEAYAQIMGDPNIMKINQNIVGFDAPFLFRQNKIRTRGPIGDTMIAQHILYPDFPKGLDFITSIHTRMPYYKDEGKMWRGTGTNIEEFWMYNGRDAISALTAWDSLAVEMTEGDYWPTYNMTIDMMDPLIFMGFVGLRIDKEALAETHGKVSKKLKELEEELTRVADYPFNPHSSAQCKNYFYMHKGITPYVGAKGQETTDDKAMARIYRKYNLPEAKLVQEIRATRKLKTTYLEIGFDADDRLRCSWNPRGTNTGRLSSSQTVFGTGANLQNLHPEFKGFIVPDKDGYHA